MRKISFVIMFIVIIYASNKSLSVQDDDLDFTNAKIRIESDNSPQPVVQPKPYPDGFFNIIGKTGFCVSANNINGKLTQQNCGSSDHLSWKAENHPNGLVILCKNGMVFDNSGQVNKNGNPTLGFTRHNGPNQLWVIESVQNENHVHFRNPQTNKCFDDTGDARVGNSYHIWECSNDNRNQWFRLNPVTSVIQPVVRPDPCPSCANDSEVHINMKPMIGKSSYQGSAKIPVFPRSNLRTPVRRFVVVEEDINGNC
jgi:hypothetical protein